ncbi:unnamed protein product [Rhizophagus irregularis]|nr:unnamed protein product [Rhizophagus irregularis]
MPIAPITGKLRKTLITDIAIAFGLGIGGGYAYCNKNNDWTFSFKCLYFFRHYSCITSNQIYIILKLIIKCKKTR